jgi:hypothetical protein
MLAVAQWTSGGECVSLTSLDPNPGERLMRMLSRSLDPKDCIDPNPTQFDFFVIISDHGMECSQYVTVTDSSAESHRADLLVAADGTYSTVFSSLYPHSSNKPLSRGYSVYRGYTEKPPADLKGNDESDSVRHCSYGFQTWGPSARFACVPTVTGNAWYIAVPDTVKKAGAVHPAPAASSSSSLHHDIVTDSSSHEGTGTASRADSSSGAFSGPFSNESVRVGQEEFDTLKKRFQGWHDPVSDILRDTVAERDALGVLRGTGVRVCAARAFSAKSTIR